MALRVGLALCCCLKLISSQCTCCEPKDDWKIDSEIRPGELGAGFLYKRAKSSAVWSKRYFIISDQKLIYYAERDRVAMKGEIVLAGASANLSTTRADEKKKYYFTVAHPQCGVREFYAKTANRREQWLMKLNEIASSLHSRAVYGKLLKQGGLSKNTWQERWCICAGATIDYFDSATDNQCKGSINIMNATINSVNVKGKHCFEITAATPGKKGNKKYVFATEKDHERDNWVEVLKKLSVATRTMIGDDVNPIHNTAASTGMASASQDDEDGPSTTASAATLEKTNSIAMVTPTELAGYLLKKSPSVMKGWQKRYFKTQENGDIVYHKNEEDSYNPSGDAKGTIFMKDVMPTNGVELNESTFEITIKLQTKKVILKAKDLDEGVEWTQNILAWVDQVNQR